MVPAGGLSFDGSRWVSCRLKFFLPVRVLSRLFRGKLLALFRQAFAEGKLEFFGQLADLAEPARFHAWLRKSKKTEWVVYAKPPFGGPEYVLKYLARYTHRVAISSSRLLSLNNGHVTFRWRDSRHGNQTKSMTLEAVEFIRRFMLHILAAGVYENSTFRLPGQPQSRICTCPLPSALERFILSRGSCYDPHPRTTISNRAPLPSLSRWRASNCRMALEGSNSNPSASSLTDGSG